MSAEQLHVLMYGRRCGKVEQANNRLSFTYDPAWPGWQSAVPLSLSMPLATPRHEHDVISAFMWGLLPDNEITLSEWGKQHHVSANNCFALLGATGEDCPGAIQFVTPERLTNLDSGGDIEWLDDDKFVELINAVSANAGRGRPTARSGQFSLAGAQAKTALARDGERWGIPSGRRATTHILKPLADQREGHVKNEHFCVRLAERAGLAAVETEVLNVDGIPVICIRRFDRQANAKGQIVRLHQEDTCQSLGVNPRNKYENEGGPTALRILQLLQEQSSSPAEDRDRFVRALAFNFLIGGTDAHAKNYALIINPKQRRLAPLYDVASYLPYMGKEKGVKLAMKIGGHYEMDRIGIGHWTELATKAGLEDPENATAHVRDLIYRLPGEALSLLHECRQVGLSTPVLDALVDAVWQRCRELARSYGAEAMQD